MELIISTKSNPRKTKQKKSKINGEKNEDENENW
jgi:hypothetical protein